jgi:hypothetical protein
MHDYIIAVPYLIYTQLEWSSEMDAFYTNANSPCLVNLGASNAGEGQTLPTQIEWMNTLVATSGPYSKQAGLCIYDYASITSSD